MSSLDYKEVKNQIIQIENCLVDCATGGERNANAEKNYKTLRDKLLRLVYTTSDTRFKELFPDLIQNHQTLNVFWNMIGTKFKTYRERRSYINEVFSPIQQYIESKIFSQTDGTPIIEPINILSPSHIEQTMAKANGRVQSKDYDGAITTARTLVAEVEDELYKRIYGKEPDEKTKDNVLHKAVIDGLKMNIQPGLNSNLKKIISGLNSIYDGLSNLRNTTGDAHKKKYIPDAHHAQLAVNSAFTLCEFLCSSYAYQQEKKSLEEIL